jgi:hypothetical protein
MRYKTCTNKYRTKWNINSFFMPCDEQQMFAVNNEVLLLSHFQKLFLSTRFFPVCSALLLGGNLIVSVIAVTI